MTSSENHAHMVTARPVNTVDDAIDGITGRPDLEKLAWLDNLVSSLSGLPAEFNEALSQLGSPSLKRVVTCGQARRRDIFPLPPWTSRASMRTSSFPWSQLALQH